MSLDYEKQFAAFFDELAEAARVIALRYFRQTFTIDDKDDKTPVTQADREIEQALRVLIAKKFPSHGILGEEFGSEKLDAEFVWVIDPIDGTKAFATGCPVFGHLIGLAHNGKPMVGVIDQPFSKERWFGIAGQFSRHNGKPTKVAPPRKLAAARMFTTTPEMFDGDYEERFKTLRKTVKWARFGADCYAYGLLALGWADLVVEQMLKPYDVFAPIAVVSGAGGYSCDFQGKEIGFQNSGAIVASSSMALAMEALEIINSK